MTYRLDFAEPLGERVRDVALDGLAAVSGALTAAGIDRDEGIHEARKNFKKLRGLLRLVRPALGEIYALENALLRDAARNLADTRDLAAMGECADDLLDHCGDDLGKSGGMLRKALKRWARQTRPEASRLDEKISAVVSTLEQAAGRVRAWPLEDMNEEVLAAGLRRTYRRGRKAYRRAYDERTGANFHEWRKRAKYHWHHLRLLRDAWPGALKVRAGAAKDLSDLLGDDHDLVMLRGHIESGALTLDKESGDKAAILGAIERRMQEFRLEAQSLGARLYAEKPKALARRIEIYCAAARREAA